MKVKLTGRGSAGVGLFLLLMLSASGCGSPLWYAGPGLGGEDQAKREKKPILLYFKSWDSSQHRNMKLKVFESPEVKTELMDMVLIEIEYAFFTKEARHYGVRRSQACVVCKPDGSKVLNTLYVSPLPTVPRFLEWLRTAKALAKPPPPASAPARSAANPASQRKPPR